MSQFQVPLLSILSLLASTVAVFLIDFQNLYLYNHPKFHLDALHSILWTFLVLVALAGMWAYYIALKMRRGGKVGRSSVGVGVVVFVVMAAVIQMVLWEVKWVRQLRWGISMAGADVGMILVAVFCKGNVKIVDGRIVGDGEYEMVSSDEEAAVKQTSNKSLAEDWHGVKRSLGGFWRSVASNASKLETKLNWRDGRWQPEVGVSREFWLEQGRVRR